MPSFLKMITGLLALSLILLGCASAGGKFTQSKSQNLAPFAAQTVDMIGNLEYGLEDRQMIYLRDITDYTEVENPFERYFALEEQAVSMLKAVAVYSMQIVAISEQNIPEVEKSQALAQVILALEEPLNRSRIVERTSDREETKAHVENVKNSTEYLQALRAAQPMVNEFSAYAGRVLDELQGELVLVGGITENAIDTKFGAALAAEKELRLIRNGYYNFLVDLSQHAETGDPELLNRMRNSIPEMDVLLKGKKILTSSDVVKVHELWTTRMATLNANHQQLLPDIKEFHEAHLELDAVIGHKNKGIREGRITFVVWSRGYGKMAAGKSDPAEWFDITETGSLLLKAAL